MTGIIIVAAGSSSRLGQAKQNVQFNGNSLLQNAVKTAVDSIGAPIIVVLGANYDNIAPSLMDFHVQIINNDDWHDGMSSSIRAGIRALQQQYTKITGVILMLCDQPFVDAELINQLIKAKATSTQKIAACAYNDTIGPPALFDLSYFPDLLLLTGQDGAKKLLIQFKDDVQAIPFPLGSVDIDTVEDLEKLNNL